MTTDLTERQTSDTVEFFDGGVLVGTLGGSREPATLTTQQAGGSKFPGASPRFSSGLRGRARRSRASTPRQQVGVVVLREDDGHGQARRPARERDGDDSATPVSTVPTGMGAAGKKLDGGGARSRARSPSASVSDGAYGDRPHPARIRAGQKFWPRSGRRRTPFVVCKVGLGGVVYGRPVDGAPERCPHHGRSPCRQEAGWPRALLQLPGVDAEALSDLGGRDEHRRVASSPGPSRMASRPPGVLPGPDAAVGRPTRGGVVDPPCRPVGAGRGPAEPV